MSRRLSVIVLLALAVAGCGSAYQSPVAEVDEEPRFLDTDRVHRVNAGETLYAIAWIYDLDFLHIARVNNLRPPYTIFPGQILNVDPRAEPAAGSAVVAGNTSRTAPAPRQSTARERTPPAVSDAPSLQPPSAAPARPAPQARTVTWDWPARGNLIGRFASGSVENKGIDIDGRAGDDVVAAAAGEVVYAGSGLLRYGDLVIIKHNDRYLSAYAHNSALLVSEGDVVDQGQKIAELGATGIDRNMLHFEIREEGQPVDPLRFLPPRS